ncbi:diguanylate cyclase (GGDEF)-like protein [Sphingomonas vulcanisoli]|uniref:diguanylate cyclase n=1 Tax=Sphingomonas vulcanisoli TaxID=1658060 RepID=A0ABX0TMB7_9SPHN|nr:GGDEF domain-containing protein [Sphingomonas vulcanisoli]NIJ06591.1 diguanylate cyclase (GGDEF)-like protein [Sphingomonas vulcanisoli]
MFVLGDTLARTRHARIWAVGFALEAWLWMLVALFDPHEVGFSAAIIPIICFTTASAICNFAGFLERAGRTPSVWLIAVATGAAIVQILLCYQSNHLLQVVAYAMFPAWRCLLFAVSVPLVAVDRKQASVTERSVIVMLLLLAISQAGMTVAAFLPMAGLSPKGAYTAALAFTTTPIAAAMGLFALMLMASDFSRERLRLIHTDPLTGVLNRVGFEEAARRQIYRSGARPLTLVLADIDRFKAINDRFGHLTGDAGLIGFARQMVDGLPDAALIGRFGGEEFTIVLPDHDGEAARSRIDAIRAALPGMVIPGGARLNLTASFGIAEHRPRETLEGLYARADAALYQSKQQGRDRTTVDATP